MCSRFAKTTTISTSTTAAVSATRLTTAHPLTPKNLFGTKPFANVLVYQKCVTKVKHGASRDVAVNASSKRVRKPKPLTLKHATACANPLYALQERNSSPNTKILAVDATALCKNAHATTTLTQMNATVNVLPKSVMRTTTSTPSIVNASAESQLNLTIAQMVPSGVQLHAYASAPLLFALTSMAMWTSISILMLKLASASVLPKHAMMDKFGTRLSALANAAHRLALTIFTGGVASKHASVVAHLLTVKKTLSGTLRPADASAYRKNALPINIGTIMNAIVNVMRQMLLALKEKSSTTKAAHVFVNQKSATPIPIHSGWALRPALAFAPHKFAQAA